MKAIKICTLAMALAFAGMMISGSANAAPVPRSSPAWALQNQQPTTQQQQTPEQAQPNDQGQQAAAESFTGKIMRKHGKYVLYVPASKMTYKLSDQSEARQFKGQTVTVQGALDSSTHTINVSNIQPASSSH